MFEPQEPALAALTRRVKEGFDPKGVLNPGRMWAGVDMIRTRCRPSFTLAQLADPDIAEAEKILRTCVHCGFCTATCPTYVLLGDELDSPRGRIYLIKDMLENDRPATAEVVKHIDRCLSCLACMTTCPSGVHYMHLVDHARVHIERPTAAAGRPRAAHGCWPACCPIRRFRLALRLALARQALRAAAATAIGLKPLAAMLRLAPARLPRRVRSQGRKVFPAAGRRAAAASHCCRAASRR